MMRTAVLRATRLVGAACLCVAGAAVAEPTSAPLRMRLQIVESCQEAAPRLRQPDGATRCSAPHQRGAPHQLPEQLRRLSPDPENRDGRAADTLVF